MSIPFNINIEGKIHECSLEETTSTSEKAVSINGKNYKIIGKEEDVAALRSQIAKHTSEFTDLGSFKISLGDLDPKEKTTSAFHRAIVSYPPSTSLSPVSSSSSASLSPWTREENVLTHNVAQLFWDRKVIGEPENTHEGFLGFLSFIALYEPAINDDLLKNLSSAIKTRDKDQFIKAFTSLPKGVVGMINHGEGLDAFPPSPARNPGKTTITERDLAQLRQYIKESNFSGVVCLSDSAGNTHTLSSEASLRGDTPFAMHSIGKMFTGMLAMKMMAAEIIPEAALDQPIQLDPAVMSRLPEEIRVHLTKEGAPTLRQLMLHQGGLGDYLTKYEAAIQDAIVGKKAIPRIGSPEDFIAYSDREIHALKKGETRYSNLGLLLVGLSLQHHYNTKNPAHKKTYQEILQFFVTNPAGLTSFSTTRPEGACYNERHPAAAHIAGGPAGGYWISPTDLLKFGQWTATEYRDEAFAGLVKEYGGEFSPEPGELSHGGQIDSATSFLGSFLPNGINVAILSNRPYHAAVIEGAIREHILAKPS